MWQEGKLVYFNPNHFPRTQDLPVIYGETSIAYVFTRESFLKHNRRLGVRPYIKEVGKIEAMDIDYPEDFEICNAIYKEINEKMSVQITDCTIRDGGYLFSKKPSREYAKGIMKGLTDAGIDFVETGFLQTNVTDDTLVYGNSQMP